MAVEPEAAALARFRDEDPGGPVVMLNLLRFGEGGFGAYQEYGRQLRDTFLPRYGAKVLYAGSAATVLVGDAGQTWDAVVVVRYPDRATFSAMIADPDYLAVARLRAEALTEAVLQATVPWR
ncbi:DUF1330 domain-containing protein [Actinophytocola glycyrrhizae]|uniref:DUF1330 domain-containing protein n=1 Tax=Actinophytocola glycyrrhizae TaxID=2044873 RepID=A0ABV9SAR4_9PSEU